MKKVLDTNGKISKLGLIIYNQSEQGAGRKTKEFNARRRIVSPYTIIRLFYLRKRSRAVSFNS